MFKVVLGQSVTEMAFKRNIQPSLFYTIHANVTIKNDMLDMNINDMCHTFYLQFVKFLANVGVYLDLCNFASILAATYDIRPSKWDSYAHKFEEWKSRRSISPRLKLSSGIAMAGALVLVKTAYHHPLDFHKYLVDNAIYLDQTVHAFGIDPLMSSVCRLHMPATQRLLIEECKFSPLLYTMRWANNFMYTIKRIPDSDTYLSFLLATLSGVDLASVLMQVAFNLIQMDCLDICKAMTLLFLGPKFKVLLILRRVHMQTVVAEYVMQTFPQVDISQFVSPSILARASLLHSVGAESMDVTKYISRVPIIRQDYYIKFHKLCAVLFNPEAGQLASSVREPISDAKISINLRLANYTLLTYPQLHLLLYELLETFLEKQTINHLMLGVCLLWCFSCPHFIEIYSHITEGCMTVGPDLFCYYKRLIEHSRVNIAQALLNNPVDGHSRMLLMANILNRTDAFLSNTLYDTHKWMELMSPLLGSSIFQQEMSERSMPRVMQFHPSLHKRHVTNKSDMTTGANSSVLTDMRALFPAHLRWVGPKPHLIRSKFDLVT